MLTLQLGHARISKPEVVSKFKGGGGDEPETLRHHPRQYIFMIGFSFITPTLTAWDRSKLRLLINLQTNERKICPQACGFVPRLTQWARGMIILFPAVGKKTREEGKKERTAPCTQRLKAVATLVKSNRHPAFREGQVGFFFFFFPFLFW